MKTKIIFTKKLSTHLVKKGFKCLDTEINLKYPNLLVFKFEDTEELRKEIENYSINLKGGTI